MRQQGRTSPRTPYSTEYRNRKGFSQTIEGHGERLTRVELRPGGVPVDDSPRTLEVYKNGFRVGAQNILDLIEGANVTLTVTDDGTAIRVEIAATGAGGSGYVTVEDEGAPLTQRSTIDFVGAGVTAADAGGKTVVTIPGGSSTGYDIIEDEGTPLAQETVLDFQGAGVVATAGAGKTVVTIPGDTGGGVRHYDAVVGPNYPGADGDTTTLATGEVVLIYKTVQAAVTGLAVVFGDDLDPPALTLFISAGTYVENVTPPLVSGAAGMALAIYGESMDTVIIAPASGDVFDVSNLVGPLYGDPQYSLELHDLTLLASGGGRALINTPSGSATSDGQTILCEQVRFVGNVEVVVGFNTDAPPTQFVRCICGGVGAGGTNDLILDGTSIRVLDCTVNGNLAMGTGGFVATVGTIKDTTVTNDVTINGDSLRLENAIILNNLNIGGGTGFNCQDIAVIGCTVNGTCSFFSDQNNFRAINNTVINFFTDDPLLTITGGVFVGNNTSSPIVSGILYGCHIAGNTGQGGGIDGGVEALAGSADNVYVGVGGVFGAGALSVTSGAVQQDFGVPSHAVSAAGIFYWDLIGLNLYVSVDNAGSWQLIGTGIGAQGMPGQDGRDGEDGERGAPGRDGAPGGAGADGRMGPPGQDAEDADDFGLWLPPGRSGPLTNRDLPTDIRSLQSFLPVLAESIPRCVVTGNGGMLSSGRLSSCSIPVRAGTPCTNLSFVSATTAAGGGIAHWWFALTDASFVPIRQSADQLSGAWAANTLKTLTLDSIPVTAGARVLSATVTLTFPTLSEPLTSLIAVGDSIVVSNANVAAYNGTFTVVTVSATQITYVSGASATDVLLAPFPTVQLAAGKRVYTPSSDALLYGVIMVAAGTVPTLAVTVVGPTTLVPILASSGNTGLTGTVPSPITTGTGSSVLPWAGIS